MSGVHAARRRRFRFSPLLVSAVVLPLAWALALTPDTTDRGPSVVAAGDGSFRVVTANIGRGAPARQCAAYERIRNLAPGTVGWQEVGEADGRCNERGALAAAYGDGWHTTGVWTHTPVTNRKAAWETKHAWSVHTLDGKPHAYPSKWLVMQRLYHRHSGQYVAIINLHMPANAYNGRQRADRRPAWDHKWSVLLKAVRIERGHDHQVVITGDFNRQGPLPPIYRSRVVWRNGPDRIIVAPAKGWWTVVHGTGQDRVGVDGHVAGYADLTFKKAS